VTNMDENFERYVDGTYLADHRDWHGGDANGKALDILDGVEAALSNGAGEAECSFVDVGCGTGGVMTVLSRCLPRRHPGRRFRFVGYEPSTEAISLGESTPDDVEIRNDHFSDSGELFDIALLVDVLEHLENPWDMLRAVRQRAHYVVVRQPLLDSVGPFRHNSYRLQRESLGHIGYWNSRSFEDLMYACGWSALSTRLVAPWELRAPTMAKPTIVHKALVRVSRETASVLITGFYRLGAYRRTAETR
jgi:SAM-dependent methyltransferase